MSSSSSSSTTTPAPSSSTLTWSPIASLKGPAGLRGTQTLLGQGAFDASRYPTAAPGDIYINATTGDIGTISASS